MITARGAALWFVLAAALLPVTAGAVLPAEHYARARERARFHLVIGVAAARDSGQAAGACPVAGRVARILRNSADRPLREGQAVTFTVSCLRRPGTPPPLGGLWTRREALAGARQLVGYFDLPDGPVAPKPGPSGPLRLSVTADQVWPVAELRVAEIPGAALAVPTAVLVDGHARVWVAHRPGMGVPRPGGVLVREAGAWRDASTGLDGEVESLHATPQGELFASGRRAAWRWESGTWVRRLSPRACLSPLRLTSLGSLLFGVCAYYPHYVAWPTRDPGDVEVSVFLPGAMDQVATVAGGGIFALSTREQALLRLPWGGDVRRQAQWEPVALPAAVGDRAFRGLWSPGPGRLVVVGTGGLVLVHDHGTWTVEDPGISDDLQAVWGSEHDGVFAVGAAGHLLHRGPGGWQPVPTGTTEPLVAIHGQPGGRVVAVGARGAVLDVVR